MNTNPFRQKILSCALRSAFDHLSGKITGGANAYIVETTESYFSNTFIPRSTLLSVRSIETDSSCKAVKVRFCEGKNAREVLDFNLFLSPQDVWKVHEEAVARIPAVSVPAQQPLGTDWTITTPVRKEFVYSQINAKERVIRSTSRISELEAEIEEISRTISSLSCRATRIRDELNSITPDKFERTREGYFEVMEPNLMVILPPVLPPRSILVDAPLCFSVVAELIKEQFPAYLYDNLVEAFPKKKKTTTPNFPQNGFKFRKK